jgi:hypothetical protein
MGRLTWHPTGSQKRLTPANQAHVERTSHFVSSIEAAAVSASGLSRAARGAVDLTGGKAGVGRRELHVNGCQFGGLTGAAERRLAVELFKLVLCRAAGNLKRRYPWFVR